MDRTEKREFVASLAQVFAETSMVVVTRNQGLTVAEVTDLRRRMRAAGATFKVAKNRLATLALDGTRFDGIKPLLKGPTALAWSTDPVAVAKTAVEFARTNEKFVRDRRRARHPDAGCGWDQGAGRAAEPGCAAGQAGGDDLRPPPPGSPACCRLRPDSSPGSSAAFAKKDEATQAAKPSADKRLTHGSPTMRAGRPVNPACMEPTKV